LLIGIANRSQIHTWQFLFFEVRHFFYLTVGYFLGKVGFETWRSPKWLLWPIVAVLVGTAVYLQVVSYSDRSAISVVGGFAAIVFGEDSAFYVLAVAFLVGAWISGSLRSFLVPVVGAAVSLFSYQLIVSARRTGFAFVLLAASFVCIRENRQARRLGSGTVITMRWFKLLVPISAALLLAFVVLPSLTTQVYSSTQDLYSSWVNSDEANLGWEMRTAEVQNITANLSKYDSWVWGRGLGTFWEEIYYQPKDLGSGWNDLIGWYTGSHVLGLDILFKYGLIGAVLYVACYVSLAVKYYKRTRIALPFERWVLDSAIAFPLLVAFELHNPRISLVAGFLLGIVSAALGYAGRGRQVECQNPNG
jgi:O-antigen ligase